MSSTTRKAFLYAGQAAALAVCVAAVASLVHNLVAGFVDASTEGLAAPDRMLPGAAGALAALAIWALLRWIAMRDGDFGREDGRAANWRRAYFCAVILAGSLMVIIGSVQLIRAMLALAGRILLIGLQQESTLYVATTPWRDSIASSLTLLIIGVPLAGVAWRQADRLAARAPETEYNAMSRVLPLRVGDLVATLATLASLAYLLHYMLAVLLGQPQGTLAEMWEKTLITPLAVLPVGLVCWLTLAGALTTGIARGGESPDAAAVRRLHFYLGAALGLCAFWLGATDLMRLILLAVARGANAALPPLPQAVARFSLGAALVLVGAPAWWGHWWPLQLRARQRGPEGNLERAFPLRRFYLYGVVVAAAIVVLLSMAMALFRFAGWRMGSNAGSNPTVALAEPLAAAVVAACWWITHAMLISDDNRLLAHDTASQEQVVAEEPVAAGQPRSYRREDLVALAAASGLAIPRAAPGPVLVIDGQDGALGAALLAALRTALPGAVLWQVGLNPAAHAAMSAALADRPPLAAPANAVANAAVILGPSDIAMPGGLGGEVGPDLAAAIAARSGPVLLLPPRNPQTRWVAAPDWPLERWIEHAVAEAAEIVAP